MNLTRSNPIQKVNDSVRQAGWRTCQVGRAAHPSGVSARAA